MLGGKNLMVQDEVVADNPVAVQWGIITRAKVTTAGASATMEQKGKHLYARILSPAGAVFEKLGATPPPPEHQQTDATKLAVTFLDRVTNLTMWWFSRPTKTSLRSPLGRLPLGQTQTNKGGIYWKRNTKPGAGAMFV
jgi:hypothetical protein